MTEGKYGLLPLANPPDSIIDIVFIHGLTGNRETTWTHKDSKNFWPQAQLPTDLPRARILTFGYDADIIRAFDIVSSNNLRDHGISLASQLAMFRKRSKTQDRPLVFVAHSLGGLVVEQALLICRGAVEEHLNAVLEATYGILFMGTPHVGSHLARWGKVLAGIASVIRKSNSEIVGVLKPGSEMLANLQQEFHTMMSLRAKEGKRAIKILCFYEELPIDAVGVIVPKHSAILSAYRSQSIHANHTEMARFTGPDDAGYVAVSGELWLWADEVEEAIEAQQAAQASAESIPNAEDVRQRRAKRFADMSDILESNESRPGPVFSGNFNTGGGPLFTGTQNAGRDIVNRKA